MEVVPNISAGFEKTTDWTQLLEGKQIIGHLRRRREYQGLAVSEGEVCHEAEGRATSESF